MNCHSICDGWSSNRSIAGSARIVALVAAISAAAAADPARQYHLVDLDAAIGLRGTPVAINNDGIVAFVSREGFSLLYDSNSGQVVQPPPIQQAGIAAITNNNNTAGTNGRTGWFVVDGVGGTVPFGGGTGSGALAVSDNGLVAGFINLPGGAFGLGKEHGVIYSPKTQQLTDLGTFGGDSSFARAVNDRGQVAGGAQFPGPRLFDNPFHAFRFFDGVMEDLGTLGGANSDAFAIDAHGRVAGAADLPGPFFDQPRHAFLFDKDGMHDLGTLPEAAFRSEARAMNDAGDAVGQSCCVGIVPHAVLFSGGEVIDLNDLAPATDGFVHDSASGINDHGAIVGTSVAPDFTRRSFLMLPVD